MRVITGEYKNRVIHAPADKSVVATTEMLREALFSILGDGVIDSRFADLFCGSGCVGVEALSRGAKRVTFVEKKRQIAETLRRTLSYLEVGNDRARVWQNDVFQLGRNPSEWADWDIVFLDPPPVVKDNFLDILYNHGTLNPNCLIVVQRPAERVSEIGSERFRLLDKRVYSKGVFYFFS